MSVTQTEQRGNTYALGHTPEEYDRLRAQARMWDAAAGRLSTRPASHLGRPAWTPAAGPARPCARWPNGSGPPAEALTRLWEAVAPGGHLIVQDYDFRSIGVLPDLASIGELTRVFTGAFIAAGADVHVGARLPELFRRAGVGAPDGTDVAGYLDPLPTGSAMVAQVFRSVLPVALAHGITTEKDAAATLAAAEQDTARYPGGQLMWPLLVGAWKRKEPA